MVNMTTTSPTKSQTSLAVVLFALSLQTSSSALDASAIFEMNRGAVGVVATVASSGSGVVIGPQTVLTNCHVVSGQREIVFRQDKISHVASLVEGSVAYDLCKLSVPTLAAKPVAIRKTQALKVGERVFAIGNPRGLELSLSDGLISGLREMENDVQIQTTAPVSPGSSGGGLFDSSGRLVGIITWFLSNGQNLNFAVPISLAAHLKPLRMVESFDEAKTLSPARLDRLIDMFERGDLEAMRTESVALLQAESGSAFALSIAGITWAELDQRELADAAFAQALKIQSNYPVAYAEQASLASLNGDQVKAQHLLSACANTKDVANSLTNAYRAFCKASLGDKSAVAEIDALIQESPNRSWLHLAASLASLALRDPDAAKRYATRSLELNPKSARAHVVLASAYILLKLPIDAVAHAEQAVALTPKSSPTLVMAVYATVIARQREKAKMYFDRLADVSPMRAREVKSKLGSNALQ